MILFLNNENLTDPITPEKGVKQGCLLSPGIFNLFVDRALRVMAKEFANVAGNDPERGPLVLAYADDMAIVACDDEAALAFMTRFVQVLGSYGLIVNAKKTKVLRTMARTHESVQTETTYWRRNETQMKYPGAWAQPCALVDYANKPATLLTSRAVLYMPSGTESILTCSHCKYPGGYVADTGMRTTPQRRMTEHARRHLKPGCKLDTKTTLLSPPRELRGITRNPTATRDHDARTIPSCETALPPANTLPQLPRHGTSNTRL